MMRTRSRVGYGNTPRVCGVILKKVQPTWRVLSDEKQKPSHPGDGINPQPTTKKETEYENARQEIAVSNYPPIY
jgi:hypothetical protein